MTNPDEQTRQVLPQGEQKSLADVATGIALYPAVKEIIKDVAQAVSGGGEAQAPVEQAPAASAEAPAEPSTD